MQPSNSKQTTNATVKNSSKASSGAGSNPQKKGKKKLLVILGSAFLAILLLGGVTTALIMRSINNKPEKVLADAMSKALRSTKTGADSLGMNMKIKMADNQSSPINEIEIKGVMSSDQNKNVQMDLEVNASIFRVRGSIQSNQDGNMYIQVKDIPSLLSSGLGDQAGIPEETKQKLLSLENKWIKISPEDIKELTGDDSFANSQKCSAAVQDLMSNKDFENNLQELYKGNQFVIINNSTNEDLNGRKMLKIDANLDQGAGKNFVRGAVETEPFKKMLEECGTNLDDFKNSASTEPSSNDSEFRNTKAYIWIDKKSREISKISFSADGYDNGRKSGDMTMDFDFTVPQTEIVTPTDTVNLLDLMRDLGIDPQSVQNSTGGFEDDSLETVAPRSLEDELQEQLNSL